MTSPSTTEELDAVILGAGVAGLYQLHQLREQGLRVRAIDKAGDVGGTWWWNRYPGARFDSEAYIYQYYFDEQLYKDWSWSEKFPGQPEVEQWLHYVTDRLDLRKDIQFSTAITSAHFDEERGRWTITTDARRRHRRPVLRELRGHAVRADGAPLRGPGQLPRPDPAHLEVARRRHRPRGQARRVSSASAPPASR